MRFGALLLLVACNRPDDDGDGDPTAPARDADGDGFIDDDCDRDDPYVHPAADELCNGVDDDCDGRVDDADDDLFSATTVYDDIDGDGAGDPDQPSVTCTPFGRPTTGDDCDDLDPAVNPSALEVCGDDIDQDCSGAADLCPGGFAVLPVAPTAGAFQWQAVQTAFVDANGEPCATSIAVAMTDQALCYVDAGSDLWCAGRIYTETYGPLFTNTGLTDVSQVLLSPTFVDAVDANSACAVVAGVPTCLGAHNEFGELGDGTTDSAEAWTPWAAGTDVQWLATGTHLEYCGVDGAGAVWCTGYGFGQTPAVAANSALSSVWVDVYHEVQVDDAQVFRVAQGRSDCAVKRGGLVCTGDSLGTAGRVVDGGIVDSLDPAVEMTFVWLEDDGSVHFGEIGGGSRPAFESLPVLAIAYSRYSDSVCAVYNDGSLACVGSNEQGKLGTGQLADLANETVVLPAGTFDLACPTIP